MSGAILPGTGRCYGLAHVARVWRLSRATVYRHRAVGGVATLAAPARRGPVGACSDAALVEHIRAQILASRLHDEGNGMAERFIRTPKQNLLWVRTFDTVEELRGGLQDFVAHYNATWLVARHGYRTPNQARADQQRLAYSHMQNPPLAD
jgi:hypothetical protein